MLEEKEEEPREKGKEEHCLAQALPPCFVDLWGYSSLSAFLILSDGRAAMLHARQLYSAKVGGV